MESFDLKSQFVQAVITTGMICVTMIIKHLVSIRICHSKCKCFGHELVEFDHQQSGAQSPTKTLTPANQLKIEIPTMEI